MEQKRRTMISKPIVYGNNAKYFGKKREEDGHTHQWTVYVKPYFNEDMSNYVKKIAFKLHDSYANNHRIITKPPYEVTETGWGEFEIGIKIFFNDPGEKPLTLYHFLKLFQTDVDLSNLNKKNLVFESFDEIVFVDPSPLMSQLLNLSKPLTVGAYIHDTDFNDRRKRQNIALDEAQNKVCSDIANVQTELKRIRHLLQQHQSDMETYSPIKS